MDDPDKNSHEVVKPIEKPDIKTQEKENVGTKIGEILSTKNQNNEPYFTEKEIEAERVLFKKSNADEIVIQHQRLAKELESRRNHGKQ